LYYHWIDTVPDWPISRQLWWGHRIPAWYCQSCPDPSLEPPDRPDQPPYGTGGLPLVAASQPAACPQCGGSHFVQDPDVLDTWFSSWLWPFSTLGWPEETEDLQYFYPTDVLVTAPDILGFWVARMVMAGLEFMDDVPFRHVYLHGIVRDEEGRKMSKSLGNSPDPIAVIDRYGADALRFSIILITATGQDAYYSEDKVSIGRNFCNKLWNAARLVLTNLAESDDLDRMAYQADDLRLEDRWILSRLDRTAGAVGRSLEGFAFNEAAMGLYDFVWHELCDWYLEVIKPRIRGPEGPSRFAAQGVVSHVLGSALRLLHPFAPFITEEVWHHLGRLLARRGPLPEEREEAAESICIAPWPQADRRWADEAAEATFGLLQEIVRAVRNVRKEMGLADRTPRLPLVLSLADPGSQAALEAHQHLLRDLAALDDIQIGVDLDKPPHAATAVFPGIEAYVPLEGAIDLDHERARLRERLEKARKFLDTSDKKLANDSFVRKAPDEVVAKERQRNAELRDEIARLEANLADLQ
ncbi:MAG: class I tRNA ligase family protein, partial [Candidatus Brocadiia bacterium]